MIFHKQIENIYKSIVFARCDGNGLVKYFTHEDFEGLQAQPYSFASSHGHTLNGNFYSYDGCDKSHLVIFEHGFGGGHLSYMKEIELLCREGYLVFAYDHTGCMTSGGASANGFSQSLCDLDDCLKALKADESVCTDSIFVMGHSWGGYSTLNIAALHPDVKKIVVFSGLVSIERMTNQVFAGPLKGYRKHIMALEAAANPRCVGYDGAKTLKNSATKALLIYSDNDNIVKKACHYDALCENLSDSKNVTLMLEHGKGHNVTYTYDALAEFGKLVKATRKAKKLKTEAEKAAFCNSFDWHRMTAQDMRVWQTIFEFLK